MSLAALGASYASYLLDVLRTLLALAGVCLLAYFALRALSRRGFGMSRAQGSDALRVVARVPLDARHSLHLVRAGTKLLLIGVGEGAAPRLIAELEADALDEPTVESSLKRGRDGPDV